MSSNRKLQYIMREKDQNEVKLEKKVDYASKIEMKMVEETRRNKEVIAKINRLKRENEQLRNDNEMLRAQGKKILEMCDSKSLD